MNTGQRDLKETIIPNNLRDVQKIREKILSEVGQCGFDEADTFGIEISLAEALGKAYVHGNRRDPSKRITVRYRLSRSVATIVIQDEGDGFDPGLVPDPTEEAHLGRESGRGIQLMKAFLDDVSYSRGGTRVRLTKRARVSNPDPADLALSPRD